MNIIEHDIKLIIGLGNPGKQYIDTRHNAGFIFIDNLLKKLDNLNDEPIVFDKKIYTAYRFRNKGIVLFKSQTFMNLSGVPLSKFLKQQEGIKAENIMVVHDDLDIKLGSFKFGLKSPKQHNGVTSIEQELGTKNFVRLRIGIDNRTEELRNIPGKKYVLSKFTKKEYDVLNKSIEDASIDLF